MTILIISAVFGLLLVTGFAYVVHEIRRERREREHEVAE